MLGREPCCYRCAVNAPEPCTLPGVVLNPRFTRIAA